MKNLFWLASYPKSGNTWVRVFLANLQKCGDEPVDINVIGDYWASGRDLFDRFSGLACSLLLNEETLRFRPSIYKFLNASLEKQVFLKTHAQYLQISEGESLFPPAASRGAIYLLRNPLDLVASFAHHNQETVDVTIEHMADAEYRLFANRDGYPKGQLFEPVSSWSQHVITWSDQREIPGLILRYEDLVLHPLESFLQIAEFTGLSCDPERIKTAIGFSSFETLGSQEKSQGFREKPRGMGSFFRKGKVGAWRDELTSAQEARIIHDHGAVMHRFGYLGEGNIPVF